MTPEETINNESVKLFLRDLEALFPRKTTPTALRMSRQTLESLPVEHRKDTYSRFSFAGMLVVIDDLPFGVFETLNADGEVIKRFPDGE